MFIFSFFIIIAISQFVSNKLLNISDNTKRFALSFEIFDTFLENIENNIKKLMKEQKDITNDIHDDYVKTVEKINI